MPTYPGTTDLTILLGATFSAILTALDGSGTAVDEGMASIVMQPTLRGNNQKTGLY